MARRNGAQAAATAAPLYVCIQPGFFQQGNARTTSPPLDLLPPPNFMEQLQATIEYINTLVFASTPSANREAIEYLIGSACAWMWNFISNKQGCEQLSQQAPSQEDQRMMQTYYAMIAKVLEILQSKHEAGGWNAARQDEWDAAMQEIKNLLQPTAVHSAPVMR